MVNPHDYNITIRRGEFEGEVCFEARVRELPDLVEYADSFDEAYALAIDSIEVTAEVFAEQGRKMPAPIEISDDFSGRVTLRLPKSLHRSLSLNADEEGVSLNQYLVSLLSYQGGFVSGIRRSANEVWSRIFSAKETVAKKAPQLRVVKTEDIELKKSA